MWDNLISKIIVAASIPLATATYYVMDNAGLTYVTKNQMNIERLYAKRDRLLDRVEDGIITDYQRGILNGLCTALNIAQAECEKRTNH